MKKPIAMLMAAIMILSITASALPLSACAATDDNQYGGGVEDIKAPQLAPLNPDFVAYWENPPDEFYGDVPPPMDLSHLDQLPVEGLPTPDTLPSSFDWRDYGKVTPVKNQNPCGTCWDFAATSVLESSVLIGESVAYDFSEQSVALCVDRSWVYLYDDWDDPCNAGGWSWLASEVFIRKGSVLETCNPYNGYALQCDGSCVCDSCPAIKKVDGFRVAARDGSQIDTIKQAIHDNGPAKMSYYHSSSYEYWDPTWGAIYDYYPCSGGTNHAVTVVGWDDDVPHSNPSHPGTGAWIIKNSWGTSDSWAGGAGVSDGYFYLAYDSSCVERIIHLEYKDHDPAEELLYWDEAGHVSSAGYGDNSAWMASVFTAASDLTHVDFWTTSNNAQYEIYVWDGFFGTQLAHQTGTCQEAGYYSIPLSTPISIGVGQQFTVGVDMTTPGYDYPIPIECEIAGRVDPPIQTDVSFIRYTSSAPWEDLADYDWNACLRARMVSEEEQPDLVIEDKWEEWVNETHYTVTYVIHNNGTAIAPACHDTTLYVDGVAIEHKHVPVDLAYCETYTDTFDATIECTGDFDIIRVCADNYDVIDELDETNNCLENEWICKEKPDLVVEKSVEFDDGKFVVSYTVINIGDGEAGESKTCKYVDGVEMENQTCPALASGASHSGAFVPEECPCGETLNVTVCADNDNKVDESNEDNNCEVNFVECPPCKPDLVIEKSVTIEDGTFTVNYTVTNIGDGPAGASNTTIYIDSVNVLEDPVPALAPGGSFTNTVGPFDCPCGVTLNVTVCADNDNVVDESNETNNCEVNEVGCPELPDLVIEEIWTKERRSGICKVYFVVKNIGCAPAPKGHYATLFVNDEPEEEKRIRKDLGPGEQYESSFRTKVSCTDIIKACADNYGDIDELNETNNCRMIEEKPDLVIEDKREEWVNETHYNVTYVIHNKGTAIAPGGHRTTLYVDGVAMEHKIVPDDLAYCETYTDTFDTVIECTEPKDIIKVCADNDRIIDEINEDNNCLQNEWICDEEVEKPDLVIEKKWEKERRGKYKVYFVVKNIGTATAPKGHHITLSVDDEEIEHKLIRRALRPGKTYRSSFKTKVECTGDFDTIEVCADDFDFVDELDETNNCLENKWICKKGD